jgi:hypothetical protein
MDRLDRNELDKLQNEQTSICLSLYMPCVAKGPECRQNSIRFKNLLKRAENSLQANDLSPQEMASILDPASRLLEDNRFWDRQSDGLAVFLSANVFEYYRLPMEFDELVVTGSRFHIKPLLRLFTGDANFYVLALSQKDVRLMQCSRYSVEDVTPEGLTKSLADALRYDEPEKSLQYHTGTGAAKGRRAAMFHGQGMGQDDSKDDIKRFFRQVDKDLSAFWNDHHAPLVLAGVEFLLPIYREANTYSNLVSEGLNGNPERLTPDELQTRAWELVEPYFKEERRQAWARFEQLVGTGKASGFLDDVVPAACHGRIDVAFLPVGRQKWGRYDAEENKVYLRDPPELGDEDLLDLVAVRTVRNGGTLYVIDPAEFPDNAPLAAIFRY